MFSTSNLIHFEINYFSLSTVFLLSLENAIKLKNLNVVNNFVYSCQTINTEKSLTERLHFFLITFTSLSNGFIPRVANFNFHPIYFKNRPLAFQGVSRCGIN